MESTRPIMSSTISSATTAPKTNWMKQSTIYRRHEARLARSYALRDDPRPAFIRVLSGLPGFRVIVPPYQPNTENGPVKLVPQGKREVGPVPRPAIGAYSEETLFVSSLNVPDNAVGSTQRNEACTEKRDTHRFISEQILQAMLATGFCSGVAEFVFAYRSNAKIAKQGVRNASAIGPLGMTASSTVHEPSLFFLHDAPAIFHGSGFRIYEGNFHASANVRSNNALASKTSRPSAGAFSKAISASFSTSLLFGTKTYLNSQMASHQVESSVHHHNNPLLTSDLLSSAMAGGIVGLSQLALLQFRQKRQQPSSFSITQQQNLNSLKLLGRNSLAACFYFSIYDWVSSPSQSETKTKQTSRKKGTLGIVMGGALAGVAHAATMNYRRYAHYGSTIWWSRIMLPAASRGAPIHALVFYGYEKMMEGTRTLP